VYILNNHHPISFPPPSFWHLTGPRLWSDLSFRCCQIITKTINKHNISIKKILKLQIFTEIFTFFCNKRKGAWVIDLNFNINYILHFN
jgi:hypothetical protein